MFIVFPGILPTMVFLLLLVGLFVANIFLTNKIDKFKGEIQEIIVEKSTELSLLKNSLEKLLIIVEEQKVQNNQLLLQIEKMKYNSEKDLKNLEELYKTMENQINYPEEISEKPDKELIEEIKKLLIS